MVILMMSLRKIPVGVEDHFKSQSTLETRSVESARIRSRFPNRIPVIVEKANSTDVKVINKSKYLVPADLTVGQFIYIIRKRLRMNETQALFIYINKCTLPPTAAMISEIYEKHHDEDGFLYALYAGENTFGTTFKNL